MVFFNYSTMQMAAKIVYYGPGLCGKTTNLQHIYNRTSSDSRGEMVSLETDTDRTLFFDLLPIDVGTIQGFNTRIQLYTVPGQVFYNTTRKLVLKGVDGVVFVADSQRAMKDTNVESFSNLEENLAEIGLTVDDVPLVLQYNKRDLRDILSVEELNQSLNRGDWPYYESSALQGDGVFETLKGISKLTLLSLKKRIAEMQASVAPRSKPAPGAAAAAAPAAAATPTPAEAPPSAPSTSSEPSAEQVAETDDLVSPSGGPVASRRGKVDILAELEKIRRQARGKVDSRPEVAASSAEAPETLETPESPETPVATSEPIQSPEPAAALDGPDPSSGSSADAPTLRINGKREIQHELSLSVPRPELIRARHLSVSFQLEDERREIVDSVVKKFDLEDPSDLEHLLLRLNIALSSET